MDSAQLNPSPVPASGPPELPRSSSLMARLFNIIAAPGEVFEEIRFRSESVPNWLVPAVLIIVVGLICNTVIFAQPNIRQQLRDVMISAMEKQFDKAKVPQEQRQQAIDAVEKIGGITQMISFYAAPFGVALVTPFWWGLLIWLFGKALKGQFTYMKAVEAAGLANVLAILESVLRTLLVLVQGNVFASPSLMLLIKDYDAQNPMHNLLTLVNAMTFWALAVRSVALAKLSGASFVKAAVWVFGFWVIFTGCLAGMGFLAQAAFTPK